MYQPPAILASFYLGTALLVTGSTAADQSPLAQCQLLELPAANGSRAAVSVDTSAANQMDHYRQTDPNWDSREDSDSCPIRLRLVTPGGPLLIDIAVTIDGQAFRRIRAAWIDEATRHQESNDVAPTPDTSEDSQSAASDQHTGLKGPTDLRARFSRYSRSIGSVDRQEARWLLDHWVGPVILPLRDGFASERVGAAPLLAGLDRDGDGSLSREEFSAAKTKLPALDVNQDDELELKELSRHGSAVSPAIIHDLQLQFVEPGDRAEIADIELVVAFGGSQDAERGVRLIRKPPDCQLHTALHVITLDGGGYHLEISALQPAGPDPAIGQVSLGAVVDGYPLFRLLDHDNDRRLSLRETRDISSLLTGLDVDQNGDLTPQEIPVPLRLALALGPHVHKILGPPTNSRISDLPENIPAPSWFANMDTNRDGDLSRHEFLGNNEQFGKLDADADGLISVLEAVQN